MTWPLHSRLRVFIAAIQSRLLASAGPVSETKSQRAEPAASGAAQSTSISQRNAETPLFVLLDRRFHRTNNRDHEAAVRALDLHLTLAKGRSASEGKA